MKLSEKIKKIRCSKELSLRDLEKLSNVRYTTIANIERGLTKVPKLDMICKLSYGLEISIDELIKDTEFDLRRK